MKLYADRLLNVFYVEGVSQAPVTDYQVVRSGDFISIFRPSLSLYDFKDLIYSSITDRNGIGFASAALLEGYLLGQLTPTTLSAAFPLLYNQDTGVMSLDQLAVTDFGNF